MVDFTRHSRAVDAIRDDSPEAIRRKKQLFERSHDDPAWRRQRIACDLWTAAFFQPLSPEIPAVTSGALADHLSGRPINARLKAIAEVLSQEQSFFHWKLEFPEVFEEGGFDVILSNPPWEQVELNEQEFFAARDFQVASAPTKAARAQLIQGLVSRPVSSFSFRRDFVSYFGYGEADRADEVASWRSESTGRLAAQFDNA